MILVLRVRRQPVGWPRSPADRYNPSSLTIQIVCFTSRIGTAYRVVGYENKDITSMFVLGDVQQSKEAAVRDFHGKIQSFLDSVES
jgi:hypothetical protein